MRYLAIDLGDKRTGLAVGDAAMRLASPVGVIEVPVVLRDGAALLEALARAIETQLGQAPSPGSHIGGPGELVVGLPLNMDGTEGAQAKRVRAFAARLQARTRRKVNFQDERLSSAAADWTMAQSGLTHKQKKTRRDALAAAEILKSFLDALPPA